MISFSPTNTAKNATEHPTILRRRWLGVSKANLARTVRDHLKFQANVLLHRVTMKPLAELALSGKAAR